MTPQPNLVRRAVPHFNTEGTTVRDRIESSQVVREVDYDALGVRDLLQQAQDMYAVTDPANARLGRIKAALITRISPVYNDQHQLQLFDDQGGFVMRDPKDGERLVVHHPDVPLQFRLKKTTSTQWAIVSRSIAQEIERRRLRRNALSALSPEQKTPADISEEQFINGFEEALQWVIEQTQVRTKHSLTGRFVAVPEPQS